MCKTSFLWCIGVLCCTASCYQAKPERKHTEACDSARQLFALASKAYDEEDFTRADSLFRLSAGTAWSGGCEPDLWAQSRLEMARTIRRSDRRGGAARAIDSLLFDLTFAQRNCPAFAGRFYFHIAYAYRTQKDFWNALIYYEKAKLAHESGPIPATANSGQFLYKPLANIYTRLGETEKAIQILRIALDSSLVQQDTMGVPDIYGDLGWAYLDGQRFDSACLQFKRGLEYTQVNPGKNEDRNAHARSLLLSNWAEVLLLQPIPEPDSATALAAAALGLDSLNAGALLTLGNASAATGNAAQADRFYARLEAIYMEEPLPLDRELSKLLLRRAKSKVEQAGRSDSEAALHYCQRALHRVIPAFKPVDNMENPSERLFYPENAILEALNLKSQILWAAYRAQPQRQLLEQADHTTALALAMSDTLSSVYGFESSKLYSLESTRDLHERFLKILFERRQRWADTVATERIAAFLEKSRALLLRQKLAGEYALQEAPIPAALRQKEDALRQELIYLKNQMATEYAEEEPDPEAITQLQGNIFRVQEARQLLMDSLKTAFPAYFEARYARPVASLADIRAMLPGDSTLFTEYFYNPESGALYALGITRTAVRLFQGSLASANVEAFLAILQDENLGRNQEGDPVFRQHFVQEARMLYDTLLAPLAGNMPLRELIISPDGLLGSLPFDLLLPREPGGGEESFRRMPYLLRQTRVRFAASATILRDARVLAGRSGGNGYFGAAPEYRPDGFFAPVKHGEACVRSLSGLFQGKLSLGPRATRERFCAEVPGFQVLHFYGHGSANGNQPELSYLAFTGGSSKGYNTESRKLAAQAQLPAEETPAVLFAHEISLLRLHAGLVVLSACETGVGRAAGSEGIFSLARAFQDAGCPSAAMTLWSVDDEATAQLTELFLQNIRAGQPKDLALQQAKLAFIEQHEGSVIPYYWSAMVLTGDAAPLHIEASDCHFLIGDETVSCLNLCLLGALLVFSLALIAGIFRR